MSLELKIKSKEIKVKFTTEDVVRVMENWRSIYLNNIQTCTEVGDKSEIGDKENFTKIYSPAGELSKDFYHLDKNTPKRLEKHRRCIEEFEKVMENYFLTSIDITHFSCIWGIPNSELFHLAQRYCDSLKKLYSFLPLTHKMKEFGDLSKKQDEFGSRIDKLGKEVIDAANKCFKYNNNNHNNNGYKK